MKGEVLPSEISKVLPLNSPNHLSDKEEVAFGFISKNGLWLFMVHDTCISIYSVETGRLCGSHSFGVSLKNPNVKITAADELFSQHIHYPCLLIAIHEENGNLLCLFDASTCSVTRSVLVPDKITSLDIISGSGGVCIDTQRLCPRLRFMFGSVAVGTLHGNVFFLDLCLDEDLDCPEGDPNITAVMRKDDFTAFKRETVIARKMHPFVHLNEESTCGTSFEFKSRTNILGHFPNGLVYVTALKYIKNLSALAVGFSFGGIQLWDLTNLSLQFTIANDHHDQAIVKFAFQEPENDPRYFCYLWTVKGHSVGEENCPNSVSIASMYTLTYYRRDVEPFGAIYTELENCRKSFELPLVPNCHDPSSVDATTRLISLQMINRKEEPESALSANESDTISEEMILCLLSWECWRDSMPPSYHLAVFDLNQWYKAHMPNTFRCNSSEFSSYLGLFSVEEVTKKFEHHELLGLHVVPHSIKKFKALSNAEEFFYPSSLSLQMLSFSESGLCKTTYFGLQRQLLFELAESGPKVLLNPKEMYSALVQSGLVNDSLGKAAPIIVQKESLLQLALEHRQLIFFMKCLKEWRYSDSMYDCCTSKALLSWVWRKVISIKNAIDKYCLPLFNCCGREFDKAYLKQLYSFRKQLHVIDRVVAGYQKYVTPRTEQGVQELQCRRDAILHINTYLPAVLWLYSVNVLPEVHEEDATPNSVVFRYNQIRDTFVLRRSRLKKLHSSLDLTSLLLVDGLVQDAGIGGSWQEKGGEGTYPPPSIYAALSCYLLDGVDIHLKHSLMYYLLLDLQDTNSGKDFATELKKFPAAFSLSKSSVKLIKAFWYLDRKDCESALKKLFHPSVNASDILPWQHQRIIKSFLSWRCPQNALKYINHMNTPQTTLEEMRLHLAVYLSCGALTQAFEYQRSRQNQIYGKDLLNNLFIGCQEMHKMKELMYLPLNDFESCELVKFLSASEDLKSQESLLIYHLLHCNFFEAEKLNKRLAQALMEKPSSEMIMERSVDREALIENLMSAIPNTERCIVEEMRKFSVDSDIYMKCKDAPQPLYVSIKLHESKQITYSNILQYLMFKDSAETPEAAHGKNRKSYFEDLPFLRPPITPERTRQPVCVKNGSNVVSKRSLQMTSPSDYASPAKRSRLLDNVPLISSPFTKCNRKAPRNLAEDIVSLLQTPPIARKTSFRSTLQKNATPQSILKKTTEIQKDFYRAPTPTSLASEDASTEEEEVMQVDEQNEEVVETENASRQIRFDLPANESTREQSLSPEINVELSPNSKGSMLDTQRVVLTPQTQRTKMAFSLLRGAVGSPRKDVSLKAPTPRTETTTTTTLSETTTESSSLSILESTRAEAISKSRANLRLSEVFSPICRSSKESRADSGIVTATQPLRFYKNTSQFKLKESSKLPEEITMDTIDSCAHQTPAADSCIASKTTESLNTESKTALECPDIVMTSDEPVEPISSHSEHEPTLREEEIFYSPLSEPPNMTPSAALEPVTLFPDSDENTCEIDLENMDFYQQGTSVGEPQTHVENPPLTFSNQAEQPMFSFSQPAKECDVSTSTKPTILPIFSFSEPTKSAEVPVLGSNTESKQQSFNFSKPTKAEGVSKLSSFGESKQQNFSFSKPTKADGVSELSSDKESIKPVFHFSEPTKGIEDSVICSKRESKQPIFNFSAPKETAEEDFALHSDKESRQPIIDVSKPAKGDEVSILSSFKQSEQTAFISSKPAKDVKDSKKGSNQAIIDVNKPTKQTEDSVLSSTKHIEDPVLSSTKHIEDSVLSSTKQEQPPAFTFSKPAQDVDDSVLTTGKKTKNRVFTFSKPKPAVEDSVSKEESKQSGTLETKTLKTVAADPSVGEKPVTPNRPVKTAKRKFVFTGSESGKQEISQEKPVESKVESQPKDVTTKVSRRTFVFSQKAVAEPKPKESKELETVPAVRDAEVLQDAKSYEEFSTVLAKSTSTKGSKNKAGRKTLLSSPQDKSVMTTPGLGLTGRRKGKPRKKKAEFSFSEPTSLASPEILESLPDPGDQPLPSFIYSPPPVYSPPCTRERLRKKRLDDTAGSSFYSFTSEVSFAARTTPPPVDPILEERIKDKKLDTTTTRRVGRPPKGSTAKKSKAKSLAHIPEANLMTSFLKEGSPARRGSTSMAKESPTKHTMVLRHPKQKPDSLF